MQSVNVIQEDETILFFGYVYHTMHLQTSLGEIIVKFWSGVPIVINQLFSIMLNNDTYRIIKHPSMKLS